MKKWAMVMHLVLLLGMMPLTANASTGGYPEVMFILDASGSMWGKVGNKTKIEIARDVMQKVVPSLPAETDVGLTAYGHNRKGDCRDIEILIPAGSKDRQSLLDRLGQISPKGMTPIAGSLQMVVDELKEKENETTIVLLSDGEETCNENPCDAVKHMAETGIRFVLHVVGFDVNDEQKAQLSCIAGAGGGNYFNADDAESLLSAFQSVQKEVTQKVEKAKTETKKTASGIGKFSIKMPTSGRKSLNKFKIIRKKDGKVLKTVEDPDAESVHPLMSGEYEVVAGFANSNYKPDSDVSLGVFSVTKGETTEIEMGCVIINIADSLDNMPAGAVIITKNDGSDFNLTLPYTGNSYYFYKPKPLMPGNYDFAVHYKKRYLYKTEKTPVVLVKNFNIAAGEETTITIDSGISIKEPAGSSLSSWELVSAESGEKIVKINQASNGDYPLWKVYAVPPGTYSMSGYIEGMTEPLPLAEGITIEKGQLLEFDTGL